MSQTLNVHVRVTDAATGAEVLAYTSTENLTVDRIIGDGFQLEGTEFRLTALHTPGHASNHLCFLLEQERLALHRVRQVYRRGPDDARGLATYTYADPTYGEFAVTVDPVGFVVSYQGLFTRVA